jgi:hypothetical protein
MYQVVMRIESLGGNVYDGTWNKALCFVCITCTMGQLVCVCSIGGGSACRQYDSCQQGGGTGSAY